MGDTLPRLVRVRLSEEVIVEPKPNTKETTMPRSVSRVFHVEGTAGTKALGQE